ncbi:MAG TPA: adenylate/guanylate cyclase domain-containing protein [Nocardioides sp.]|uniref:adenylate/guanylate cyclase domain-containing protein n=1 Tax=Nocardioides sp. TaxID=35761 RepID=UPI002C5C6795|nr:adenylate/guanylate cyclase domain-containing protein [Nocardioides sp.]HQR27211.1 adenylate/guanylate cyclase domain-containing protein [Nocardioides sp.]
MTTPDPPGPDDLTRAILRGDVELDAEQVSELTGVPVADAGRLWRALGFPEHAGETVFTRSDAEALETLTGVVASGALDFDTAVNLTRAVGQTMARLADWEVATLVARIEQLEAGTGATGSRRATALQMVDQVNEPFERLLVYAWRRHLAAATARVEALGANEEDLHTVELTVGFADIVSFTKLSNELDEDGIGELVEEFESRCADVVAAQGGRVIKSIGDSVLFVHEEPLAALATAEGIIESVGRDERLPDVRLGLATGPVVMRMGDVFGRPVNLAARMTAVARRNRVIVDEATARTLPAEEFRVRRLPARPVHGFGLVEPLTVRRHR